MFHQIDQRIVKLTNLNKNGILSNFDFHGRPFKSDIFWVTTVANSWICNRRNSEYIGLRGSDMEIKVA